MKNLLNYTLVIILTLCSLVTLPWAFILLVNKYTKWLDEESKELHKVIKSF